MIARLFFHVQCAWLVCVTRYELYLVPSRPGGLYNMPPSPPPCSTIVHAEVRPHPHQHGSGLWDVEAENDFAVARCVSENPA
jgi:hypothetical protein